MTEIKICHICKKEYLVKYNPDTDAPALCPSCMENTLDKLRKLMANTEIVEQELIGVISQMYKSCVVTFCEYKLYNPHDEGYEPDRLYYRCSCGAGYIDIENAEEWKHCPYCGNEISNKEMRTCDTCKHAKQDEEEGEDTEFMYCSHPNGKHDGYIQGYDFDGCQHYKERVEN